MSASEHPLPERRPPKGVPRWLWPPPGAVVDRTEIREAVDESGRVRYDVPLGSPPEHRHLRALQWLLHEHRRATLPPMGCPFDGLVVLEIARTTLPAGRVGFAYALNGGPLGDPGADAGRGILWRYLHSRVSPVE